MQEVWCSPINDERGRPSLKDPTSSLRPSLFVLREDKTLSRYDVQTGQLHQSLYLSSERKFVELSLNAQGQANVVLKSTKLKGFCQNPSCHHTTCNKTCIAFILFSYPELKFLAHLEISQNVFGSTLYNAVICDAFIIVIHGTKHAKLYGLNQVLSQNVFQTFKIGDEVFPAQGTPGTIGEQPLGFPVNVLIKKEPTMLYSVSCTDYDVGFSSFFPPLCVSTAKDDCYKVRF